MYQVVQIGGSLLILAAYLLGLTGRLDPARPSYLLANAVGSAVLTVIAIIGQEWGFLLLEGVWCIASTVSLIRLAAGRPIRAGAH